MRKFTKVLCLTMAFGMAFGVVACGKKGSSESKRLETANTAIEAAMNYTGSFTATTTYSYTSQYPDHQSDKLSTHKMDNTIKASYNAETREGYRSVDRSSSTKLEGDTQEPTPSVSKDITKIVKDGDWYYMYNSHKSGDNDPTISGSKYKASLYPQKDYFLEEDYSYANMSEVEVSWIGVTDLDDFVDAYKEIYKDDANSTVETSVTKNDDDSVTLAVKTSGTLSNTIENVTMSIAQSYDTAITVKDEKIVKIAHSSSSVSKTGDEIEYSSSSTTNTTFSYSFDKTAYDATLATGLPDKTTIDEVSSYTRDVEYVNVVDSFMSNDRDFTVDLTKTTAEQVAAFKANFATADEKYGAATAFYTDKAMTKELKNDISDAEWQALETVYVKRPATQTAAYVQESYSYVFPKNWEWVFGMNEDYNYDSDVVTDFTEPYELEDMAQLAAIEGISGKVLVNGKETTDTTLTLEAGKFYKIEYQLTVTDAKAMLLM